MIPLAGELTVSDSPPPKNDNTETLQIKDGRMVFGGASELPEAGGEVAPAVSTGVNADCD